MFKKLMLASILFAGSSTLAFGADLQCLIGNTGWKNTNCFYQKMSFDNSNENAYFRVTNTSKQINQVLWSGVTACGTSATSCSVSVGPYQNHVSDVTILYTDGTYEQATSTVRFELLY